MSHKIKVDVNEDEIQVGGEMILCLADQQLLDGDQLNEVDDVLENDLIKVQDQIKKNEKKHIIVRNMMAKRRRKSQISTMKIKIEKEGFYIASDGKLIDEPKQNDLQAIKSKLNKNQQISLNVIDNVASDYKPSIPTTLIKKKFQKPQQANPFAEERISKIDKAILEEDDYELLQRSILNQQRQKMNQQIQKQEDNIKELMDQNKQKEEELHKIKQNEFMIPQVKIQGSEVQEIKVIEQSTDFLSNVKTDKEMEEINLRINTGYSIRDTKNGTTSVVNVRLPTERIVVQNRQQQSKMELENIREEIQKNDIFVEKEEQQEEQQEKDNNEIKKDEDGIEFLEEGQHVHGLTATLGLLRKRGELNPSKYDYVGRNKDQRVFKDQEQKDGEINLVYRDHSGKLMTPKEAFRYQCWIFHGDGPSKNKIEKKKRSELIRQKQKMRAQSEGPLMQALKEEQKKKGVAHLVIGKKKQ
ncbi:unnamed protein product (macronuclear) [Paramecium tetraurelia]|uniref:SART-1 family protein n=1 Tax=Paramecium tetraurelia TaxID=5888 RepID=A0D5A4_PARTE|nr:uncharacterized protein GSPATT00013669001 [Paramecium tetraurelia]CAK78221.1 unnamed protein product [Paramecium tetraurelia]|eukprot:XP_001445618.1 hypothetical protein (macronuclear) [Paramecium tetraurelia strain d4-2]